MATSAQTKLLCHFNGANGATTYTSDDANARVATFSGSAQLSTAQKKFGTASLLLANATSDYLTFPDSADWAFGTSDFTIDMWVYITTLPTSGNERQWLGQNDNWTTAWYLSVYNDAGTYYLNFAINGSNIIARTIALSTDTWTHIAVVRSGNSWYEFKDGTQLGGVATNSSSVPDVNSALVFGTGWNDAIVGYIDEPRIVVGSAEWTASFTPLTSEYSFLLTGVSYMES